MVYEKGRTGFEERKDFVPEVGSLVAGRYRVQDYLGTAVFSTAVECLDMAATRAKQVQAQQVEGEVEPELVCLKIIRNNKDFLDQSLDEIKVRSGLAKQALPPCRRLT